MMPFRLTYQKLALVVLQQLLVSLPILAQDLDPRAYVWLPVKTNALVWGLSNSHGGVVTDPTLHVENAKATVQVASLGYAHSFSIFGLSSQAMVAVPYSWAQGSGSYMNQQQSITRSGLADARLRLTVLVHGAPAVSLAEFGKAPKKTIVGVSMNVVAPSGEFFPDKLINLGNHRWSFRPEIALSQPVGKRWLIDVYAGVWFFTTNHTFYPGNSARSQQPMEAFQAHISYNIGLRLWVALDATYYIGGQSSVNGTYNDDRQENARIGATAVVPIGKRNSLKFAASSGVVVRIGQDFTTFSIGWQRSWFGKSQKKSATTN